MAAVQHEKRGRIGLINIDQPPVNALSFAVRSGLLAALRSLEADPGVDAIVLAAAGRSFPAGADIAEFGGAMRDPQLPEVVNAFEACAKPVVAALFGTVLGGGLELALGCHWRIARAGTRLGLPEVKLGLIPGAGGTQRLPRLIGATRALDLVVSGAPIGASEALALGLVDAVVEGGLLDAALAHAEDLVAGGAAPRRSGARTVDPASVPDGLFEQRRAALGRHPSGPLAARAAIDAVQAAVELPLVEGMAREAALFAECYRSPYAAALWHVFFAERAAAVIPDLPRGLQPRPVRQVAVLGAGTMGSGIALCFANADLPVVLLENNPDALQRGLGQVRDWFAGQVAKGRLDAQVATRRAASVRGTQDYADLAEADLVIEAVFESMTVKREVFGKLDAVCKPGAILASNTSTLDVDQIAAATTRPADVLGLHFFSPAIVMRLLEVVRARHTAPAVMATAMTVAKQIGKVAVQAGVCFGFIGNRMIEAYSEEALNLLLEGATPVQVDAALEAFGLAMGPFAMGDLAGNDVGYRIRQERPLNAEQQRIFALPDQLVELGRHGQKTGKGFHAYAPGQRKPLPDPEVEALVVAASARLGIERRAIGAEEIVERCLYQLVNEGARILEEGIALRASDIDTVYVNGYGFPAWRGGPMFMAGQRGLPEVLARIREFHARHGERWRPAALLERLVAEGRGFAELDAALQGAG